MTCVLPYSLTGRGCISGNSEKTIVDKTVVSCNAWLGQGELATFRSLATVCTRPPLRLLSHAPCGSHASHLTASR
jgi:hypothetical protein